MTKEEMIEALKTCSSNKELQAYFKVVGSTIRKYLTRYKLKLSHRKTNCVVCGKELTGKQRTACSEVCRNSYKYQKNQDPHNLVNKKSQQMRGLERKLELIRLKGGACTHCGYKKNLSALAFHHNDPNQKELVLDMRHITNTGWKRILREVEKCVLLCHNCHNEVHNPHLNGVIP